MTNDIYNLLRIRRAFHNKKLNSTDDEYGFYFRREQIYSNRRFFFEVQEILNTLIPDGCAINAKINFEQFELFCTG